MEKISNFNFLLSTFLENGILFENKTIKIISKLNLSNTEKGNLEMYLKIVNVSNKNLNNFSYQIIGKFSNY